MMKSIQIIASLRAHDNPSHKYVAHPVEGKKSAHAQRKSDCIQFVERLVGLAYANAGSGATWVGRDFGARVMLLAQTDSFKNQETVGVKKMFTTHQGGWAFAHIQGVAGAYLIGKDTVVPGGTQTGSQRVQQQFNEDLDQLSEANKNNEGDRIMEKMSEINDDQAGVIFGAALKGVINGTISRTEARNGLAEFLCNF